jgi:hypothetical protein
LPTKQHNLLATMQLRLNDVIVNDVPKFLTDKPNKLTHIISVLGSSTDPNDRLVIPLTIHRVTSSFPTRKPTTTVASGETLSTSSSLTNNTAVSKNMRQTGSIILITRLIEKEKDKDAIIGFHFMATHKVGTMLQTSVEHTNGKAVPDNWILLDSQSTFSVFHNAKLLHNIRESSRHMDIHCTTGITSTNLVRDLSGYGTVWYHPKGIANILSLTDM